MTKDELDATLRYDADSGVFYWIGNRRGSSASNGYRAGSINGRGYVQIHIGRKFHMAHRLAWLHVYGELPDREIDHKNGIRHDNRISNLRIASRGENRQNMASRKGSTSKYVGVSRYKPKDQWQAQICIDYKRIHLGFFDTEVEAAEAYRIAKSNLHRFNPAPRDHAAIAAELGSKP